MWSYEESSEYSNVTAPAALVVSSYEYDDYVSGCTVSVYTEVTGVQVRSYSGLQSPTGVREDVAVPACAGLTLIRISGIAFIVLQFCLMFPLLVMVGGLKGRLVVLAAANAIDLDQVPDWNRSEVPLQPRPEPGDTLDENEGDQEPVVPVDQDASVVSVWRQEYAVSWKVTAVLTSLLTIAACLGVAGYAAWLHALQHPTPSWLMWLSLVVTTTQPLHLALALPAIRRVYLDIRTRE
jgi:hypothetical protein